jgi:hypothetical protein
VDSQAGTYHLSSKGNQLFRNMTTIKVGDTMPSGSFGIMTKDGPGSKSTEDLFSGKKVALFSKFCSFITIRYGTRMCLIGRMFFYSCVFDWPYI